MPVVAVIGASTDRRKFGNQAVRAFRARGYTVVPVHPHAAAIEGERAYPSVTAYPGHIDEATFYVPPDIGLGLLDEVARKGVGRVWLNPGAESPVMIARARVLGLVVQVACSILQLP